MIAFNAVILYTKHAIFIIDVCRKSATFQVKIREISCLRCRGWFVIDLVAAIPFDLLLFGSDTDEVSPSCIHGLDVETVLKLTLRPEPLYIMIICR